MSSDEIIRHIVRDITVRASNALRVRREHDAAESGSISITSTAAHTQPSTASAEHADINSDPAHLTAPSQQPGAGLSAPATAASHDAHSGHSAAPQPPKTPLPEAARNIFMVPIQSHVPPAHVSETLAAFLIRAVVLDSRYGFRIERELSRDEIDRLIGLCVQKIVAQNDPVQETVRMQVYFDTNFPAQNDFLHKEKLTRLDACSSLLREILDVKSKSLSAYEALYRKIVSYVLIRTHVGNATDLRVIREATAALESVFPQSELNAFISLARSEKEAQMNGLAQLVTGIRLFNKQLGKGGDSIENLPELCAIELRELTIMLHEHTQRTEQLVQQYKAILDYADSTPNSEVSEDFADRIRNALVFRRQYLIYLDALQEQVTKARQSLVSVGEKFDDCMRELKITCKSKTAVPVDQVYPQFVALSNLWAGWTDELFLLAFRRGIVEQLDYHSRSFTIEVSSLINILCERFRADIEPEILPESEVIAKASTTMTTVAMINKTVEIIHPGNTTQYYKLPVEYGGFCAYSIVSRRGLIVPGDKNLGMVRHRDRLFAFGNLDCIVEFCKSPDTYMERIVDIAKQQPALVQLLHLYNYFPTVEALERARSYTRQRLLGQMPMVAEIACQVDTHIVDANTNAKYRWNEWDLRRQALLLVNLKDKRTHSTQTDLSHFRRDSETQYYQPKQSETQTKRTSSTNVPKTRVFYAGLRNNGMPLPNGMYVSPYEPRRANFKVVDMSIDHDGGPVPYGGGAFVTNCKTVMPPIASERAQTDGTSQTNDGTYSNTTSQGTDRSSLLSGMTESAGESLTGSLPPSGSVTAKPINLSVAATSL